MPSLLAELAPDIDEHRRLRAAFLDGIIHIESELDELILDVFEVPVEDGRALLFQAVLLPTVNISTKIDIAEQVIEFAKLEQVFSRLPPELRQNNSLRNDIAHRAVWMRSSLKTGGIQLVFKGFKKGKEHTTKMSPTVLKKRVEALGALWMELVRLRIALAAALGYDPPALPSVLRERIANRGT